jgi:hypothetical protein
MSESVFDSLRFDPVEPAPASHTAIALETLGNLPIHGLRHPPELDTNGWYIWCGEYSDADDFFQSLHIEHLIERLPEVRKFISLPPGYRFLIDTDGYEDIWFDESLLDVSE